MSLHCARKVGGEEQSELYKHIKRAVGHGEGKAKQKAANQEGDHERNQRPSITQRQDEKTSMCACRTAVQHLQANLLFAPNPDRLDL